MFSKWLFLVMDLVRAVSVEKFLVYLTAFKRVGEKELKKARLGN